MTVSVPLVVILGAIVYVAWRFMGMRGWHAIFCLLFGFFLAATASGPDIRRTVTAIVRAISAH